MTVQAVLCQTWSELKLLVFSCTGSNGEELVKVTNSGGRTMKKHDESEGSENALISYGLRCGSLGPGQDNMETSNLVQRTATASNDGDSVHVDTGNDGLIDQDRNRDSFQEAPTSNELNEEGVQTPMVADTTLVTTTDNTTESLNLHNDFNNDGNVYDAVGTDTDLVILEWTEKSSSSATLSQEVCCTVVVFASKLIR